MFRGRKGASNASPESALKVVTCAETEPPGPWKASCADPPYGCDRDDVNQADDAGTLADVATVSFILGGAALGTSLILFLTDSKEQPSTTLAITPSHVALKGRF